MINFRKMMKKDIHLYMEGDTYNPDTDVKTNLIEIIATLLSFPLLLFIARSIIILLFS